MVGYIKKIEQIKFGLMSPEDIREMSAVTVETPDTYEDDGFPIEKGLMDPRLGVIDPSLVCRTCGFRGGDCQGHFGSIELARPVIHIGFGDVIHKILRSTCNNCGRVLLPQDVIDDYANKISEALENRKSISDILKRLQNDTKKVEMTEAKQNDIVEKIMKEIYPEEGDYDDADREDILLNILNQLYAEAYVERDESKKIHQFKYIDPKHLCPHCKKNQSIDDIEAGYEMLETKNSIDLAKLRQKAKTGLEEEFEKKINKIDMRIEKLEEKGYEETIEKWLENKVQLIADFEEKFDDKIEKEIKKHTRNYIKQYLQELIQEPILLDKPVTIRQGDYKLTPSEVRERLENISDDDSYVLGVNPEVARPEWMVLTVLSVPPVTVRPSITLDTGERSEDDLTHKLVDILRINQRLLENMEAGAPQLIVEDLWELLQYHVTTYFDNDALGVPPARHRSGRPLKTLTQRLKGKEGRFRSNLSGKRVNFSARTVISPDPNISINEVGVPEMIAKEVTVPAYVTDFNMHEMKKFIQNGPDVHPGANYVIRNDGRKIRVRTDETKELILEQLEPGFIIERHLKDGDMVLFNRQPSLHRMSMMAHEVKVMPYKTFRLNLCVCPPYNADFDGDEMNMHVFQTDESRAEAKSLLRVQEHILSPRFGGPIIGAIHDHISGAYLLTRDGFELTEEQALQFIRKSHLKIPPVINNQWVLKYDPDADEDSFIYKDKGEKWTGKELFSLLLPNDLNLSYDAEISNAPVVYPQEDATVVIKKGILTQGVIDESAYGSFSGKILDKIVKEYGPGRAKEFLDRSTDLAICGIMKTGITTSLNDDEIPTEAQDRINEHLDKKMAEVDKLVESYEEGYLTALPGRTLEETLEMKIMQVVGEARDMSGQIAENYLTMGKQSDDDPYDHVMAVENHSVVMARTGARASMLNLTQITACVGQQIIRGGRIERGYLNRTLPHFKKGELGAKAKGFVHSSYKSGLDPIEFFFHAMGGREGLVDTAIRTAQSGYMQRRLVNALQDLQVKPSGLVTDNQGNVIQTMYGDDGVDPAKSDFGKPVDLNKLIEEIRMENGLDIDEHKKIVNDRLKVNDLKIKLDSLIGKHNRLYEQISDEIDYLAKYDIKNNLAELLDELTKNIDSISAAMKKEDYEEIYSDFVKYDASYVEYKSNFDDEIERINESNDDLFKKEVLSKTNVFEGLINHLTDLINIQKDNENSFLDKINNLFDGLEKLAGKFTPDLQSDKDILLNNCYNMKIDFEANVSIDENLSLNISKINDEYEQLSNFIRVNEDFANKSYELESGIDNIKKQLNTKKSLLEEYENNFDDLKSDYDNLIASLNRIDEIFVELDSLKDPIAQIEESISNQKVRQDSLEKDIEGMLDTLKGIDVSSLTNDLSAERGALSYYLEEEIYEFLIKEKDFEMEYRPHYPALKVIYGELIELSMPYELFEEKFSLLKEHIANIQDKLNHHDNRLNSYESFFNEQKENYDGFIEEVNNQKIVREEENNQDDLYDQIVKYNELLKEGIITKEEFDELKRKLIFGNDSVENQKEPEIEENETVLEFRNYVENSPFYGFTRNQFNNISDDEVNEILNEIELDIVEGKITTRNWNEIIRNRFENYGGGNHVKNLIANLDDFIANSRNYKSLSSEFSDLSDDEKNESVKKLKESFTSDFKQDDIPVRLKILFEEKRKEKHDLNVLNEYREKSNYFMSKYNLYEQELIDLFDVAQNDIYESKLTGISFEEYMVQQFNKKVDDNKTAARSRFALFVNKKSKLKEFTMLDDSQVSLLIEDVQLSISKNEIRDNQITEEFLIRRSVKFR